MVKETGSQNEVQLPKLLSEWAAGARFKRRPPSLQNLPVPHLLNAGVKGDCLPEEAGPMTEK